MHPGGQRYRSMVEIGGAVASSEDGSLSEMLNLIANVANWSVSYYCRCYGRLLDASRFAGMFTDGWSKTTFNRRGMRHDTDIDAWKQSWS